MHGKLGVVHTLLVRCCCDPDLTDSCGTTPLMDAMRAGHVSVGHLLLEYGVCFQSI
jgi:ankyrin repeat protein